MSVKIKYTKEIIKNQLKQAKDILNKNPSFLWWDKNSKTYGWCNRATIQKRFGSWNNAIFETFGDCYIQPKPVEIICAFCKKVDYRNLYEFNKSKSGNHFCSRSCSVTYNNTHKTHGTKRSKLEIWLEEQLTTLYPNIEIHFNRKDAINSELDIYIPSLSLAFELSGIFHYEPIYGKEKLEKIQNNDGRKFQACLENNIELCIIDTSGLKYTKPEKYKKYLDIICSVINLSITGQGIEPC